MKSVALCGDSPTLLSQVPGAKTVEIEGIPVSVGLVETVELCSASEIVGRAHAVVVRVRAFSCNYRDKARMLRVSQLCQERSKYAFFGSEFVGEVRAVGSGVTAFQVGDRVMADNNFSRTSVAEVEPGIPLEVSSQRDLVVHEAKLIKVPPEMPDEVAAAFSLNAQTAYGMLRRLEVMPGAHVLVTSARSNASLFVLQALKTFSCHVYALTSAPQFECEPEMLGIEEVIHWNARDGSLRKQEQIAAFYARTGGFDYVIDPFFDLYLGEVLEVMAMEGAYTSCGLYDQYSQMTDHPFEYTGKTLSQVMSMAMTRNIRLIGNCLGRTADLQCAIDDYRRGSFSVILDTVCEGEQVETFLQRTYIDRDRFGKVVYRYE